MMGALCTKAVQSNQLPQHHVPWFDEFREWL